LYIGKAKNLKSRVKSYFQTKNLGLKTKILVSQIKDISYIRVASEIEALLLEANLIKKYQPKYNIELKDNKSYPFIKITIHEEYPRILSVRKIEKDKAKYFGPFPNTSSLRYVLKLLRKMFPYCTCKNHPKSCLYASLGLCPHPKHEIGIIEYKKNINRIISFLEGHKTLVTNDLKREMEKNAKNQNFEIADKLKNQIQIINDLTNPKITPSQYIENPNLIFDRRNEELSDIRKTFNLANNPVRIECYDISNISGKEATGSMVVFINGEESKKDYRRFKIKSKNTPDDTLMLKEVFRRRFNNSNWPYPDLIVVDGGKGQLSSLISVLDEIKQKIPSIALAKKKEEIFMEKNEKIVMITLPKNFPALNLLIRLRNEAHRFAKNYFILLHEKRFFNKN